MPTLTARERREIARAEFDAFYDDCPSRVVLTRLADKWVALVVFALGERDMRYSELARQVAGVSQKMLTQTLRNLERDGVVTRSVEPTVPVTVTYGLTELGRGLGLILDELVVWSEEHVTQIEHARDRYDAR